MPWTRRAARFLDEALHKIVGTRRAQIRSERLTRSWSRRSRKIVREREDTFTLRCATVGLPRRTGNSWAPLPSKRVGVDQIPALLLPSEAQQGKLSGASWKSPASAAVPCTTSMTRSFPSAAQRSSAPRAVISSRCDVLYRPPVPMFGLSEPWTGVKSSFPHCAICKQPSTTTA